MAPSSLAAPRKRTETYTAYGDGCAVVWAGILAATERWASARKWAQIRLMCGGWWMGWTSATIARLVSPPPKQRGTTGTT